MPYLTDTRQETVIVQLLLTVSPFKFFIAKKLEISNNYYLAPSDLFEIKSELNEHLDTDVQGDNSSNKVWSKKKHLLNQRNVD
jgi:hypothetical protein